MRSVAVVHGQEASASFTDALLAAQGRMGEGVVVVGDGLRIRWASDALRDLLGYRDAELSALSLLSLIAPEDCELVQTRARKRLAGEAVPPRYQLDMVKKGGERLRVEVSVARLSLDGEERLLGIVRDRTDEQRAEEARRATDQQFRRLADASLDMIGLSGVVGPWRFVSPACRQVLGYEQEELVGHTDGWDLMHPEDREEVMRLYETGLTTARTTVPVSFRMRRRDGNWVWVESLAKLILDEKGSVSEVYFAMRDISERRAAEAALRRSENRFRALTERLPEGIVVHHGETVAYANAALCALLDYRSVEELAGRPLSEIFLDDDQVPDGILTGDAPAATGPSEVRLRKRDGGSITVEAVRIAIELEGRPATLISVRDVTERRAIQNRLVRADRMISIGTLAAGVAHEINNPLVAVIANLDYAVEIAPLLDAAARRVPVEEPRIAELSVELKNTLEDARIGAGRVRKIVSDLKMFARGNDDQRGAIDVRPILDSSISLAWNEIRHRARLQKRYHPVPPVPANEARLGQVFVNLLINAAQSIVEGQADRNEIAVSTGTDEEGRAVIEIRDSGQGIPPAIRARIFDPFFTTKAIGVGTGLGLSICHGIVSALGGEITVESEPDRGSIFRVILPTASAQVLDRPAAGATDHLPVRRGRVLIIDDDLIVASVVARTLSDAHEVISVTSGAEALDELARAPFDLVLCDLMMPVMTGMDLHARLRQTHPELARRMVFITGGAFTERAREFLNSVDNPRLEKPFDARTLRSLVAEQLR